MAGSSGIGGNCCCGTDCPRCFRAARCGVGLAASFTSYLVTDPDDPCGGTPLDDSGATPVTEWCTAFPGPGHYAVVANPGAGEPVACLDFAIADDDCEPSETITVPVPPPTYDREITVYGCFRNPYFGGETKATVPGLTVHYSDGVNTVSADTDADGKVTFTDLPTPPTGNSYAITVDLPSGCGYVDPGESGTVDPCTLALRVDLVVASTHVCVGYTWPVRKSLPYVDANVSMTLNYVGSGVGGGVWVGCASQNTTLFEPVDCTSGGYSGADAKRYDAGASGPTPVHVSLQITGYTCGSGNPSLKVQFEKWVWAASNGRICDPFNFGNASNHPINSCWVAIPGTPTAYETRSIDCDTADDDILNSIGVYVVGDTIGGPTGEDWLEYTFDCGCLTGATLAGHTAISYPAGWLMGGFESDFTVTL